MRLPKIITVEKSDIVREDTVKIGHYSRINMIDESWKESESAYDKQIKKIEKIIRSSYEYREYINYLKDEIDMNECSFFKNLKRDDIRIEIHHAPFTLYDITSIVFFYLQSNKLEATPFDVAEMVMKLHYEGLVGLIPLSLTVHELVHTGDVFIPIDLVHGNIKEFVKKYKEYMSEDQKNLLLKNIEETNKLNNEKYNPSILERKYTYIEVDGMELPQKIKNDEEDIA